MAHSSAVTYCFMVLIELTLGPHADCPGEFAAGGPAFVCACGTPSSVVVPCSLSIVLCPQAKPNESVLAVACAEEGIYK